jgi:hypothetical protein
MVVFVHETLKRSVALMGPPRVRSVL